jgi:uncharacterized membrane protein YgcG
VAAGVASAVVAEAASAVEVQAVAGRDLKPLSIRQRRRVERAVDEAENLTGLQLCIYLGSVEGETDLRAHAEDVFVRSGMHGRPAVLLLVAPPQRKVEVVTAEAVRERIPDSAAGEAVEAMVTRFRDGDLSGGLVAGIEQLAAAAGPGTAGPGDEELPDVIGG